MNETLFEWIFTAVHVDKLQYQWILMWIMQGIKLSSLENLPQSQECFETFFCGDSLLMVLNTINFSGFTIKKN